MLSYRHEFHAGNFADVLKHLILLKTLEYLNKKDSPILYIDTHAGAGLYHTQSPSISKTQEYQHGFGLLNFDELPASAQIYAQHVQTYTQRHLYPGSPLLTANMLRAQDQLRLFELHPQDFTHLQQNLAHRKRCIISQTDGLAGLKALLPVQNARALVLIDPSYEIKSDYMSVVKTVEQAYKRMPNALFLIWYPVILRQTVNDMIHKLKQAKVRDLWQFELAIAADSDARGMTASGIFAINPPWTLARDLQDILPALQTQVSPQHGSHLVRALIEE